MEDKKSELLEYAREYATANKDLYELLSVPADAAQPEVHRAWRKASLKHHPDKAKAFDPEVWQLFERARDVLSSPEARAAYDAGRAAAARTAAARAALDAKKRAMIDDLEARERGVKRKAGDGDGDGRHMMTEAEKRALMQKGREHLERRRRMREEAEARERERERTREDGAGVEAMRRDARDDPGRPGPAHVPAAAAAASAPTGERLGDTTARPAAADELDERIADIERKLRERKAEKAARRGDKKKKNGDEDSNSSNTTTAGKYETPLLNGENVGGSTAAAKLPSSSSSSSPFRSTVGTRPPTSNPLVSGDFSSTMARLRAAQREKERKKAEAAADAVAAVTTAAATTTTTTTT